MAQLKGGTTIGGYLSYHSNNANLSTVPWLASTVTATTFIGALTGNATTASTSTNATNATNATNVDVATSTTSASRAFVFTTSVTAGNKRLYTDTATTCYINPNSNTIGATTFIGGLIGNSSSASYASNVTIVDESADTSCYILYVTANSGNIPVKVGTNLTFNSSTGALTATSFSGSFSGNASTATVLQTGRQINGVTFNGSANITVEPYISADDTGDTNNPIVFTNTGTVGYKRLYEDGALYFDNTNNRLYSTWFYGSLSGNVTGNVTGSAGSCTGNASTATTATNANFVDIDNDDTGDTNNPIVFTATSTTGFKKLYEDSAIYINNTNNYIYAAGFSGALSGNATTCTTAAKVTVANNASATFYPLVWHNNSSILYDTATLKVQPSTGTIRISGDMIPDTDNTGNVGTSTYTWTNGRFTSMTVDSVLSVRGAIDLADSDVLRLGSSDDIEHFFNGSYYYTDINTGSYWYIRDNTTNRFRFTRTTGQFDADGDIIAYSTSVSDRRLKENINNLESSLEKVLKLRGVNFEWIEKNKDGTHVGYIAQEIEEIIPEVVVERNLMKFDDELYKVVRYEEIIPYISEAIKEQQDMINELKEEIKILKNK